LSRFCQTSATNELCNSEEGLVMVSVEARKIQQTSHSELVNPKKKRTSFLQWFSNLPIKSKQLTGLFASEIISVFGLVGVGAVLIVVGGRAQLVEQAKSELAVTENNYNLKTDKIQAIFRAQASDTAAIAAAIAHSEGRPLSPELDRQVEQLLQNEIEANDIEYATLVGRDRRIIANANANRQGEIFDPNQLVSEALEEAQPLQATHIVPQSELARESPPLPEGLAQGDALIRYTVTPVQDSETGATLGALVSGDIVDGKTTIPQNTLETFDGGYSAIYAYQPSQGFDLATALADGEAAPGDLTIRDRAFLQQAVDKPGEPVTSRQVVGTQTYTMAAQALTDSNGEPVAVLVRGTSETALNAILGGSLLLQLAVSALALTADVILAILLGKSISQPLKRLQGTTQQFAQGDHQVRAEVTTTDEVGQLAQTFNELADNIVVQAETLSQQASLQTAAERSRAFAQHTSNLYRSLKVDDILNTAAEGVRRVIQSDRVVIYNFNADYQNGVIAAESAAPGWVKGMGQVIHDPLTPEILEKFQAGMVSVCNDVRERNLSLCHCKILARLQVRANLVAPIHRGNKLVGLLCAHQCSGARIWQPHEIELFQQLATQIGVALSQSHLIEQSEHSRQEAEFARRQAETASEQAELARQETEFASREQQHQAEMLQMQMLLLLQDIEDSRMGDLTVRSEVTEGTIGTVADFFNAIIESLGQLVRQVQVVSTQVNGLLFENEQAVGQLSEQALKQAEDIHHALGSVEQMTHTIQDVAKNARQAAEVARFASTTAQTGGEAIDLTVEQIVNLRETVVRTADKVKRLGVSSQQIAKVIAIIHEISLKTNLLAINAGVEASRAGEGGEGFRVVAEQIGELAKQSVATTQEIEQALDAINEGTQEVVQAMQEGKTQAIDSTKTVLRAKESLAQIFEVSHQIDALVQSISSATVLQAQTSQSVTEVMHNIASTSQHTFDSSHTVSHALRETVEVASKLQESVGRFKIEAGSEDILR
jgi:twitching motility protein PilJ